MASSIGSTSNGTISSAGIGSGLDVNSIVTQLMAIEQRPLTALQTKATAIQSTVSEYGKIKSAISTLRDLAVKLASKSTWGQTVATSSGPAVSGTTNGSTAGTYTVEVSSLASVQTLASASRAATDPVGAGTLRIEMGTWGSDGSPTPTFTAATPPAAVDVVLTATDTLAEARDKINAAGAGVTAMIMNDAGGSRLLIRSNATGAANGFRSSGVAALAFDPSAGVSTMTRSQTAADAVATINGLPVTSTSNTLSQIVDGLTLNLTAPTTSPVTVSVVSDIESLKKTITDFAAAYTAVYKLIAADTKYDPTTKKGGILQGDSAAVGLQNQLRTMAGGASGASTVFSHLSDAGLRIQGDGSMTVDASKLANALGNLGEITKLFSASSLVDPAQDGFAKRFRSAADAMLGVSGSLATRTDGLGQQLQRNQKDQDRLSLRLAGIEKRMRAQYTALDTQMASLTTQSGYVAQQIAAWNSGKA